jgi:NAD(P)-dependent dehydrogenase (short-subunit alcohol dehydrogenase family)
MNLRGMTALVTGAGSGIGEATARLFAKAGAKVALLSDTAQEVEAVADRIKRDDGDAFAICADIADPIAMQGAVRAIDQRWGQLDVLIANAGINGVAAPIDRLAVEEFDRTIRTNLRGTFITVQAAFPMLKKRGGAIVVTSSVNGNVLFNDPGTVAYSSTKAAQVAMVKVLAIEFAQAKVRINAVLPGSIKTKIDDNTEKRDVDQIGPRVKYPDGEIPLTGKKPGQPEQVARLMLFLASGEADHITGAAVVIDGGQSLIE